MLFGFAIMPDHIHMLLQTQSESKSISVILNSIKNNIYKRIRHEFNVKEAFWQKSFYTTLKDTAELFDTTVAYMKNNPRKWDLPKQYDIYPYQYVNDELIKTYRGMLGRSG